MATGVGELPPQVGLDPVTVHVKRRMVPVLLACSNWPSTRTPDAEKDSETDDMVPVSHEPSLIWSTMAALVAIDVVSNGP